MEQQKNDKGQPQIVYVQQQQQSNYSWIFWIIIIAILGFLAYYIITTMEELKDPFKWFDILGYFGGVLIGY